MNRFILSGSVLLVTLFLLVVRFLGPVQYRNLSVGGVSVIAGTFLLLFAFGLFKGDPAFHKMRNRIKSKSEERALVAIGAFVFFLGFMLIFDYLQLK
jgi:hypothetical protein